MVTAAAVTVLTLECQRPSLYYLTKKTYVVVVTVYGTLVVTGI